MGAWGAVYGELLAFDDPDFSPARHQRPGGLQPRRFQLLPAQACSGRGKRIPRTRLFLQGRNEGF